jgi:hypothetical protein
MVGGEKVARKTGRMMAVIVVGVVVGCFHRCLRQSKLKGLIKI